MATAKGSNVQLLLVEESTWGTTPGTPAGYKIPVSQVSIGMRRNLIDNTELRGNRNAAAPVKGNVSVEGNFVHPLHLDAVGWLLKHGIGAPTTSGIGPYTHVFKVGSSLPTGIELEVGYTDIGQYELHKGCRVQSLRFQAEPEGVAQVTVTVVGRETTAGSSSVDSTPTEYTSVAIPQFDASIQEGGAAIAIVTALDLTVENNLDDSVYVVGGSGLRADLPEDTVRVTGQLTALFQDLTLYNKALNHTESSLKLTWTSGSESLEILVPELVYEPASPAVNGPAGVRITLNFRGYYQDSTEASVVQATLVNSVASY